MGKLNIFEITLSNFQGVYYAGQNMKGHITVELTKEMSIIGIRLKFKGKASVRFSESNIILLESTTYHSSEKYFEEEMLLFGILPGQGRDTVKLPAGRTTFPFCFGLPPDLPSSFEGTDGSVKYTVTAIIDRSGMHTSTKIRPFTIIGIMDLNADANAVMPIEGANEKTLFASGPISASFHLERRGYVPGEPIKLMANIKNNSKTNMKNSYVELKMITTYHTPGKSQTSKKAVSRVTEGPIEMGQSFTWDGSQMFVVPPLPPSNLPGCQIIDIKYTLTLKVKPSALKVPLDIIIGTIPLHEVVELCPPRAPQPLQPQIRYRLPASGMYGGVVMPLVYSQPAMPSNAPDLPPHSYRKCAIKKWGETDTEDNDDPRVYLEYAPLYIYYDWGHQPTTMSEAP